MFRLDYYHQVVFGLLSVWKQLPGTIVELVAIACALTQLPTIWIIGILVAVSATISFFKFGLISNLIMLPGATYANWLKWPIRIAVLFFIGSHEWDRAIFLAAMFLGGTRLFLAPWNAVFDRLLVYSLHGQLLEYRAFQLIWERCVRVLPISLFPLLNLPSTLPGGRSFEQFIGGICGLPLFALPDPLLGLPLKLQNGESFHQVTNALVEAGKIENTDPARYAAIVDAASKIIGHSETERLIKIFTELEQTDWESEFCEADELSSD